MIGETSWADEQGRRLRLAVRRALDRVARRVIVAAVIVCITGLFLGCAVTQWDTAWEQHDQDVTELRVEIGDATKEAEALRAEVSLLRMDVDILQGEVEGMAFQQLLIQNAIVHLSPKVDRFLSFKIAKTISWVSDGYGMDPFLIVALMHYESRFNPKALSSAGARGLMQVMLEWCDDYGITKKQLWDIETNIDVGAGILDQCLHDCDDDLACALGMYHGSGTHGKYARNVNASYKKLLKEFDDDRREWIVEWELEPTTAVEAAESDTGADEGDAGADGSK